MFNPKKIDSPAKAALVGGAIGAVAQPAVYGFELTLGFLTLVFDSLCSSTLCRNGVITVMAVPISIFGYVASCVTSLGVPVLSSNDNVDVAVKGALAGAAIGVTAYSFFGGGMEQTRARSKSEESVCSVNKPKTM